MEHFKCLIIGSGPAGYTAAIYAGRANLAPVLYAGMQPGGQLTITTDIENFPGQPEPVNGFELMERMRLQAQRYGADIRSGNVTAVDFSRRPYTVTVDGTDSVEADTVIIATGASAKYLGLPDEQKYAGAGVSACATCDGFFYRKKTVAVVGGGDSACEEASYLSHLASKVYLVVRKPHLRASQIMQQRVTSAPNIEILYQHEVRGLYGEKFVEGARLVRHTPGGDIDVDLPIDGLFLAIGRPRMITGDMVREGAVIIDVGINRTDDGLCGDADFESVSKKAAAITPVPGGVGPMTIAMLLKNTVQAWEGRA